MPDVRMWALNIVWLIGALICLTASTVILVALWIALRVYVFRWQQRRSFEAYRKQSRRADGRTYPPHTGGVCEQCGRVRKVVYHLPSGEKLCHDCYEAWWPTAEGWGQGSLGTAPGPPGPGEREAPGPPEYTESIRNVT